MDDATSALRQIEQINKNNNIKKRKLFFLRNHVQLFGEEAQYLTV